ncbi:hypothetical protein GVAMD_1210 [Gardnerella vaginalis AMD]|nr:hypothetical protein GVAMD_1210 [Gardnerella vaginalis AMD]
MIGSITHLKTDFLGFAESESADDSFAEDLFLVDLRICKPANRTSLSKLSRQAFANLVKLINPLPKSKTGG